MSEDEKTKQGFTVVDRRRFDEEGNVRGDQANSGQAASSAQASSADISQGPPEQPASVQKDSSSLDPESQQIPEIDFSSFVMSLATQALMQMGELQAPPGMDLQVDRDSAKQTIDILSLLEEKTKGNLDDNEQHLLTEILHNLRLSYVRGA